MRLFIDYHIMKHIVKEIFYVFSYISVFASHHALCFNKLKIAAARQTIIVGTRLHTLRQRREKPGNFFVLSGSFSLRAGLLLAFKALHPIDGRQWGMSLLLNI